MEPRISKIRQNLEQAFQPHYLEIIDDSSKHAGHIEAGGQETHLRITLVSGRFHGMKLVRRHQMVYDLLQKEFKMGLHALSIRAFAPEEWNKQTH